MLWIAGVHILGLRACHLLLPALRDNPVVPTQGTDGESDDGWAAAQAAPPHRRPAPRGIPLPDAVPSLVRLREPGRSVNGSQPGAPSHP